MRRGGVVGSAPPRTGGDPSSNLGPGENFSLILLKVCLHYFFNEREKNPFGPGFRSLARNSGIRIFLLIYFFSSVGVKVFFESARIFLVCLKNF